MTWPERWLEIKREMGTPAPSDVLASARDLNPHLDIDIDYAPTARIVVRSVRGESVTVRMTDEPWVACFRRAGLM